MSIALLKEIEKWKLDAKQEDSARYFYHTSDLKLIENGSRCYVIGRKGTGKTAICEHLFQTKAHDRFAKKLTFKNFPFNDLYRLSNDNYNPPNQYITLWKYIIYSSIAKMMMDNQNINPDIRLKLQQVYSADPVTSLSKTIERWTGRDISLNVLGTGVGGGKTREIVSNEVSWIDRVDILESLIYQYIDDALYFVAFDELDEDYAYMLEPTRKQQYYALLTSLFKAVQDVKATFPSTKRMILPVIFLRDDIYEGVRDPDKTKWMDFTIDLDWSILNLQHVIAFRISRAEDPKSLGSLFKESWDKVFSPYPIPVGTRQTRTMSSFNYITRSTMLRPRDYIKYLQVCSTDSLAQNYFLVGPNTVVQVDKAFSNYLRSEVEDELGGILPEIHEILDAISQMRKQMFHIQEFRNFYAQLVKSANLPLRPVDWILTTLFNFSVIGNQPKQRNIQVFKYARKEARLNFGEIICVHRGLFKALQIL
jgi:hypothetical protein